VVVSSRSYGIRQEVIGLDGLALGAGLHRALGAGFGGSRWFWAVRNYGGSGCL